MLLKAVALSNEASGGLFQRNEEGDIDESLIPQALLDWYDDTDDEEETVEEVESDVEEDS